HRQLPLDGSGRETGGGGGDEEAADAVVGGGPDDGDVGGRGQADPALGAVEDPAAVGSAGGGGGHGSGIGPGGRLGQSEAADELACRHAGQVPVLLLLGPQFVDRRHRQ